jgi:uncharacterized SAM-binding protein YcdF (DUF218 family)
MSCLSGLLLLVLSVNPVADALLAPLENAWKPFDAAIVDSSQFDAVVVLGGGIIDRSPEENFGASLGADPTKRIIYGIRLAKVTGKPLVFSGGRTFSGPDVESEADAARRFLDKNAPGMEARFEDKSRNTRENARFVHDSLGIKRAILVTSAYHMSRAVFAFRNSGISVLAAPCDYKSNRSAYHINDFLPSLGAFSNSWRAIHEYLGLLLAG